MQVEAPNLNPEASIGLPAGGASERRRFSHRKTLLLEQAEKLAYQRDDWSKRHRYYYEEEWRYMRFLIPSGKRILDLGCGNGNLLNALQPSEGVGIDFSAAKISRAKATHPHLKWGAARIDETLG